MLKWPTLREEKGRTEEGVGAVEGRDERKAEAVGEAVGEIRQHLDHRERNYHPCYLRKRTRHYPTRSERSYKNVEGA